MTLLRCALFGHAPAGPVLPVAVLSEAAGNGAPAVVPIASRVCRRCRVLVLWEGEENTS